MAITLTDASADTIDCGAGVTVPASNLTFALWTYSTGNSQNNGIMGRFEDGSDNSNEFVVRSGAENIAIFFKYGTTGADARSDGGAYVDNVWSFVAATIDSSKNPKLYKGNLTTVVVETGYTVGPNQGVGTFTQSSNNFRIGSREPAANRGFGGRIGPSYFLDVTLTAAELESLKWGFIPQRGNLKGFWLPGFHGATNSPDLSGQGNNATITGGVVADHVPLGPPFGFDIPSFMPPVAVVGPTLRRPYDNYMRNLVTR
jgi:hypothetical protein